MQNKKFKLQEVVKKLSLCALTFLILFLGFFSNYWGVAEQEWFSSHQHDTESLIIGRIVKSSQDGMFSAGGLPGAGMSNNIHSDWITPEQVREQYSAYLNGGSFKEYSPYMSQIGGQGILFSLLDSLLPISPQRKLKLFYLLTSLLTAIALSSIVLWFYLEFGMIVAISVACSMVFSQWLTIFGRNLWWSIWAFYLPMILVMFLFRYKGTQLYNSFRSLGIVVVVSVLIKCIINGYEYITTTLIMMTIPFVYYSVLFRFGFRKFIRGMVLSVVCSFAAVLLSFMVLSVQIYCVKGEVSAGVEHILFSFGKRTYGDVKDYSESYRNSLQSNVIDVTVKYARGIFFDLNNYISTSNSLVSNVVFKVRYKYLLVLFMGMSVLVIYLKKNNMSGEGRLKEGALVVATWVSVLAPLSWYVIFKAHSSIHTNINYIVWQMPFSLFGFAVCGLVIKNMRISLWVNPNR